VLVTSVIIQCFEMRTVRLLGSGSCDNVPASAVQLSRGRGAAGGESEARADRLLDALFPSPHPAGRVAEHLDSRVVKLAGTVAEHRIRRVPDLPGVSRAAVALVVRPEPHDLEVLLIKRAPRVGDPWSGHMALPGGRQEVGDPDPLATAIRETREEVGIDLHTFGVPLGALDELQPLGAGVPPLAISPFCFAVRFRVEVVPNREVAAAMWVPLAELAAPASRAEYVHRFEDGRSLSFPALACRGETVWGLTYRILSQFMALAAVSLEAGR
jgi:8-oxo-dGTP pyrophosphatase MutT (NUDIX family)